jgi:hypothetical protein
MTLRNLSLKTQQFILHILLCYWLGKKVGTIFYKGKVVLPHIAEISAQAHLELEKNCLSALVIAMDVRLSFFRFSHQYKLNSLIGGLLFAVHLKRSKETEQKSSASQLKLPAHQAIMPQSSQLNTPQTAANRVPEQHTYQKLEYKQNVRLFVVNSCRLITYPHLPQFRTLSFSHFNPTTCS